MKIQVVLYIKSILHTRQYIGYIREWQIAILACN